MKIFILQRKLIAESEREGGVNKALHGATLFHLAAPCLLQLLHWLTDPGDKLSRSHV